MAMVLFSSLIVTSAIQFFKAEDTRWMIAWATGFAVCLLSLCDTGCEQREQPVPPGALTHSRWPSGRRDQSA